MSNKQPKAKKEPLKTRNPFKYYRRKYRIFGLTKWACIVTPIASVIGVYVLQANQGAPNTNPVNSIAFPIGASIGGIFGLVVLLKEMISANKAREQNAVGLNFNSAIGWGIAALVLWLCAITTQYLTILCLSEFVGQVGAVMCRYKMNHYADLMKTVTKAEITADAFRRKGVSVNTGGNTSEPIE